MFCSGNRGCEILNQSRNGTIESCSFYCCHTEQCNAGSSVSSTSPPLPTTTEEPATLTAVPTTQPEQCGGSLSGSSGSFSSPNYPGNYPNNARCIWTTTVPRGSQFRIEFVFFHTERRYDYLNVYVGRRLVRHLTGKGSHKDKVTHIQGTGELISIVFRSDHSVTRRGFYAKYRIGHEPTCGGPLTGSSGNFKSPGYPGNYPNNIECKWTITVPRRSYLVLAFRTFDTERCHDYVKIFRGSRLTRKLSGRNGRYRGRDDKRFLYQDDDECDDDDDDDDDDVDYDDDNNNNDDNYNGYQSVADDSERTYRRYTYARRAKNRHVSRTKSRYRPRGRHGSQAKGRYGSRGRNRHRSPYVARVYMRGTGEQISIVFKSNHRNRRKGFLASYRVSQGRYGGG
ncbi:deleted in malignant brain tumors 1 protein-like [Orbicella faveolata]|uniref:deleted in malignant brain tumors 1 protein-like n=1 Tax=Orbicella faveolata TaxID=48498 RepID=UPI0009E3C395|nr:deleted in malignant brain tumors 1 protein-like [Orbicella faveolata]